MRSLKFSEMPALLATSTRGTTQLHFEHSLSYNDPATAPGGAIYTER